MSFINNLGLMFSLIVGGITIISALAWVIIYIFGLRKDVDFSKQYIDHLIDEGKKFKETQFKFEETISGIRISLAHIDERQQAATQNIIEIKEILKSK